MRLIFYRPFNLDLSKKALLPHRVSRANKIIPKVINITEVVGSFVIPDECPVCHATAVVRESESGTKTLHCT